jgi:hypothetical protein
MEPDPAAAMTDADLAFIALIDRRLGDAARRNARPPLVRPIDDVQRPR